MNKAKFVFFGSPEFAAIILEKLIEADFVPLVVVCNPDKPFGRKKIITPPPVKQLITNNSQLTIKILQPEKLSEIKEKLIALKPDFFIVAAYSKIIKKEILDIPRLGTIGVHPSLLPRHRGASPIQQTILDGDGEAGVSLFMIDEGVDSGPILASEKLKVKSEKYEELENKLANLGADLLVKILPRFINNEIKPVKQDDSKATFTKKFKTEDAFVDLEKDNPEIIVKKIRALNPEPGCWTILNGKRTKLLNAEINNGKLVLKQIQMEGKTPQLLLKS